MLTCVRNTRPWLVAAALAGVGFVPALVAAQQTPYSAAEIPLVPGTSRDPQAEAQFRAGPDSATRSVRAYRIGASIEALYKWYLNRLGAQPDDGSDSVVPMRAGLTSIKYQMTFHTFDDRCGDGGAAAEGAPVADAATCHTLLRGTAKKKVLDNVRIPFDRGRWIESASFIWFRRDTTGELTRLRVLIRDIGLSPDWKRYTPLGQLVLMSDVVQPGKAGAGVGVGP